MKTPSTNFTAMSGDERDRLIYRSWGPEKVGKNHFGYTMPGPIYGLYFDPGGVEGVAKKFILGQVEGIPKKQIHQVTYRFKKHTDQADAIAVRDQFLEDWDYALKHARSIQLDETECWETFRWAEFDSESTAPKNYGKLNAQYRALIQAAYDHGVNLQLIQKVKERWVADDKGKNVAPSGVFEPVGFKEANYIVQANFCHGWSKERGFTLDVVNCRQNMGIAGDQYVNTTFPEVAAAIFPTTTEDDWQ